MEIKIPKEVRSHKETLFFGLSARQFFCSALAVGVAVGVYLLMNDVLGRETASWLCIVAAAPFAVAGFFRYNGLTFEKFLWAVIKSELLRSRPRVYRSENIYIQAMNAAAKKKGSKKEKGGMSND